MFAAFMQVSRGFFSRTYVCVAGWVATRWQGARTAMAQMKDYTSICSSGTSEYLSVVALRNKEKVLERTVGIAQRNLALLDVFFTEIPSVLSWVRTVRLATALGRWCSGPNVWVRQARPTGGATGFPRLHFVPKLKAYLESVAAGQPKATDGQPRPLIEVFCEDLVVKQGTPLCFLKRTMTVRRPFITAFACAVRCAGVLLLPGSCYDESCADHFRLGFGRADMSAALDKLRAYLHAILEDQQE